ncbi:5-amino-6-(5-phospho-D-ribitylamino)uracil phosphatase YigB [Vibrio sp. SCSIO 43135]|uniref:5-amino-6-(5-phospho-D-ribitylamino)uracil phosphatase YigB n=1 Tax=Vibrio sp. SCSIO 43135 TaxID=2819096 RepID=UPI0020759783|nr:5-amino-6-(5-phospho-D-ribitylamino)uracil phosphatase YigB [Vibrio sp. SCSIO 43135]USD41025.1 5-amino-6-(5-phospho-D-ribitylamino)uracil phosphatase YigB [Vibrio sp. SCSIO 43135]
MHFYRRLSPIKAMSFDLDDTLYDNRPIIRRVERQMAEWLHQKHPVSATQPLSWWQTLKREVALKDPMLTHDVTLWRHTQIQQGLSALGYTPLQAKQAADEAIIKVLELRSQFDVPQESHRVMGLLAQKLPLVAITNGNVDVNRIGLAPYFQLVLKAGPDGKAKPFPDMFDQARDYLQLPAHNILHVGDHLKSDVYGAKVNGFQACWFNDQGDSLTQHRHARSLPDVEIHQLDELLDLLD